MWPGAGGGGGGFVLVFRIIIGIITGIWAQLTNSQIGVVTRLYVRPTSQEMSLFCLQFFLLFVYYDMTIYLQPLELNSPHCVRMPLTV